MGDWAYLCTWRSIKIVVDSATDEYQARRIFQEYLERYKKLQVDISELSAEYVLLITNRRGFVEYAN